MTDPSHDDGLDPEIRLFVKRMGELWRQHPPLDAVSVQEARRIAELVRAPWTRGGPQMARTTERVVPCAAGTVRIRALDPTTRSPKGALLYLHGGGWTFFSIDTHDRLMREYAARAGIVVIGVDYSLSPEAKFPRAIEETVAVIRWLRHNGAELGVDPRRLAIGGDSAGAAMTISACMMLRDAGDSEGVRAMLLNYGAFDAACATESYQRFGAGGYLWDPGEMAAFWRNYLRDERDAGNPFACPLRADVTGLPPAFLAIPACDVMYDESMQMAEKLRRAGVAAQTAVYPGATHSFLEAVSIARISDRGFAEASRWLSDMLA
jgi:acetyl esterase